MVFRHHHHPSQLSLSLFRFEKPPAPSRLDNVTTRDTYSSALFLLILDRYVFCLVRFSRDFVPNRQGTSSASNIPSRIKLISWSSRIHSLSPGRRNVLTLNQQFLPKNQQFLPSNLSGFTHSSPLLCRYSPQPSTASRLSVSLRFRLSGTFGHVLVRKGPAQGLH